MTSGKTQPPQRRRSLRIDLDAHVAIRRTGISSHKVKISDLSTEGRQFEFVIASKVDDQVWVRLPGLESIEGTVRWVEAPCAGVQFDRPLYPAVFDLLVRRMRLR